MKKEISFRELNLITGLQTLKSGFAVIDSERDRLAPWFWWMSKKVTTNKTKFLLFMLCYLAETIYKQIMHKLNSKNLYDEQFLIMVDGEFAGMTGLDNINDETKDAEMWRFISKSNEGMGVGSASIKFLEQYSLDSKGLERLYAKINTQNTRSIECVKRNGFVLKSTEHNIPTSRRNPKLADIMTWEKVLSK